MFLPGRTQLKGAPKGRCSPSRTTVAAQFLWTSSSPPGNSLTAGGHMARAPCSAGSAPWLRGLGAAGTPRGPGADGALGQPPPPPPLLLKPHFQSCLHRTVMAAEKATWAEQVFMHQGQVCFPRTRHLLSPQCSPLGPHLGHLCCHPVSSYTPGSIKPSFEMLLGVVSPNKHAGMCAWETRTAFWGNKRYFSPFPTFPHFQLTH